MSKINIGDSVNRLTLVSRVTEQRNGRKVHKGKFRCECGKEITIPTTFVINGHTKSCGCLRSELLSQRNYKHGEKDSKLCKKWYSLRARCNSPSYSHNKYQKDNVKVCEEWNDFEAFKDWSYSNGYNDDVECLLRRFNAADSFNPRNCIWSPKNYSLTRLYKIWMGMLVRCYNSSFKQYCNYGGRGIQVYDGWRTNFFAFKEWSEQNGYDKKLSIDRMDNNWHYCPDNCRWATSQQQVESKHNNRLVLAFSELKTILHWSRDPRCVVNIDELKDRLNNGTKTEEAISSKE